MNALWRFIRWFLFKLDAENAHRIMVGLLHSVLPRIGRAPLRVLIGSNPAPTRAPEAFGMHFASRVGLAAGFDKDAEILGALPALGFGFAEIGTVTPLPQPGNERPRLFRDPAHQAVFNRMGFNGSGAAAVSARLARIRPGLPADFRVGVNIGKNKDTALENAASDYAKAAAPFAGLADYLVINVSSPNTPGLRSLQTVEALKPIVEGVQSVIADWPRKTPLLLKLAPELKGEALSEVMTNVERWGIDGWVLTNTLAGTHRGPTGELPGGWSGAPLTEISRQSLREALETTRLPIISVGGIMSVEEAEERVRMGAALVQLYSGWIYRGPAFPVEVSRRLAVT